MTIPRQLHSNRRSLLALLVLLFLMGCVPDQDYTPVVTQFQQSADTLSHAFQTLLTNANLVEYDHYIDSQAFEHAPLSTSEIDSRAVITPEELKLRSDAIRALAQYTSALATLAQGKQEEKIVQDATTASTSFSSLATDSQTAAASHHLIPTTADYAGPISSAASAAGIILGLIERHRTHEEIRQSIEKNDPALTALFDMLGTESQAIYGRQKSTQSAEGVLLFTDYNREIALAAPDKDYLLQLSDRIKQFRRNQALVDQADPTAAIAAFKKSHDALVAVILAPKDAKPRTLAELVTSVKSFAAEVQPLEAGSKAASAKN
jgi:hypothetical protein